MDRRPEDSGDEFELEQQRQIRENTFDWEALDQARGPANPIDYWRETGLAAGQLRGCLMIPLGFIIYFGGFVALIAWGNSILILFLWMFLIGPITVSLVAFGLTWVMLPIAAVLMLMAKVLHWGEEKSSR
ncbi:MAG: hypothetical protein Q7T33_09370 [Dehalococcoidia bacterium]|nr:hypothetical protein [Dehalococcoidia bacterium]